MRRALVLAGGIAAVYIFTLLPLACGSDDKSPAAISDAAPSDSATNTNDASANDATTGDGSSTLDAGAACPDRECTDAELDAGADASGCIPKRMYLLAEEQSARAVAVDGTHVYFADEGDKDASATIKKVPICGGPVTVLVPGNDIYQMDMSIGVDGTGVYWTNGVKGTLNKVGLNGGQPIELAKFDALGSLGALQLALDTTHVYFPITKAASMGSVNRVSLAGGDSTPIAASQYSPRSVAIDATNVYWTNSASPDAGVTSGRVYKMPLAGGTPTPLATDQDSPVGVAVDATNVYFSTSTTVKRVPIAGGTPVTIATESSPAWQVAVDATHVYWATQDAIKRAPIGGGTAVKVAEPLVGSPVALALDAKSVYWAAIGRTLGPDPKPNGHVGRISK